MSFADLEGAEPGIRLGTPSATCESIEVRVGRRERNESPIDPARADGVIILRKCCRHSRSPRGRYAGAGVLGNHGVST